MLLRGERSLNTLGKRMMKFHIFKMLKMCLHRGDGMWRLTDAAGVVLRPHQTASLSTVVISRPLSEFLLFLLGDTHAPLSLSIYVFPSSTLAWREAWDFWRVNTFGEVPGRWQVIGLGSMSGQLQTSVTFLITLTKYVTEITGGRRNLFRLIMSVHHIEKGRKTAWSFQQWGHVMEESCLHHGHELGSREPRPKPEVAAIFKVSK